MQNKLAGFFVAILLFMLFGHLQQAYALSASGANEDLRFIKQQTSLLPSCQLGSVTTCENKISTVLLKVRSKLESVNSKLHPYDTQKMQEATSAFIARAREILAGVKVATSSLESEFAKLETLASDLATSLVPSLTANENRTFPKLARLLRDSETLSVDAPKIKNYTAKLVNFEIDVNTVLDDTYAEFSGLGKNSVNKDDSEYLQKTVLQILDNVDEALKLAERRLSSKLDDDFEVVQERVTVKKNEMKSKLASLQSGTARSNSVIKSATSNRINATQLIVSLMRADNNINQLKLKAGVANNRSAFYGVRDSLLNVLNVVKINLNKKITLSPANLSLVDLYTGYIGRDCVETLELLGDNMPNRMTKEFSELNTKVKSELADIEAQVVAL